MFKKGVSVYIGLSQYNHFKNLEYIRNAKQLGYEIVFTSAHISEANFNIEELQELIDEVCKLDMKLSLDISKKVYDKITLPPNLYALRLDYGFNYDEIIKFSNEKKYKIEINASTFSQETILELIKKGLNSKQIRASFNYYPKLHTGHTIEFCQKTIEFYHHLGITISGFIPSHCSFRAPMYEGLPTVENHRKINLNLAIEEFKACEIDEILFSDAYASNEELKLLSYHQKEEIMIEFEPYNGFKNFDFISDIFHIRTDYNDELLRISGKRQLEITPFNNGCERKIYDLTVDNKDFLRYSGEINIILKNLEPDRRVNVIGHLNISKIIIEQIKKGKPFCFIEKKYE